VEISTKIFIRGNNMGIFMYKVLPTLLAIFLVITFKLWLFGSLIVSGVKSVSDSCGKTYPVEIYVVNGDWFCAEEGK
jgi:hypothetical protein